MKNSHGVKNILLLIPIIISISFSIGLATGCNRGINSGDNSGGVAFAPTDQICTNYNYNNGFYYDTNGQVVTCNSGTNHCFNFRYNSHLGYHVDANGRRVHCSNDLFDYEIIFPYDTVTRNGCSVYTHGVFYPVLIENSLVCMGYSYLTNAFSQSYLNQIYVGGMWYWYPGNPILSGCYKDSPHCSCNNAFYSGYYYEVSSWCWTSF